LMSRVFPSTFTPGLCRGHEKAREMPLRRQSLGPRWCGPKRAQSWPICITVGPHLLAVDAPAVEAFRDSRTARVSMCVAIGAKECRLGQPKNLITRLPPIERTFDELGPLGGPSRSPPGPSPRRGCFATMIARSALIVSAKTEAPGGECSRSLSSRGFDPSLAPTFPSAAPEAKISGRHRPRLRASRHQLVPTRGAGAPPGVVESVPGPFATVVRRSRSVVRPAP